MGRKMNIKIKAIFFDFDGVLTTDVTGSTSICNYISKTTNIDLEIFKKEYYKYNHDLLYGKTTHNEIWQQLCNNLNKQIDISILKESFINTPMDKQMLSIAKSLKANGYRIGMITDNKIDRINCIIDYLNLQDLFDNITISASIGSGKETSEIFTKAIDSLQINANECVFIDNQEKNLVIPKQMGFECIYFDHQKRNFDELKDELYKINVIY